MYFRYTFLSLFSSLFFVSYVELGMSFDSPAPSTTPAPSMTRPAISDVKALSSTNISLTLYGALNITWNSFGLIDGPVFVYVCNKWANIYTHNSGVCRENNYCWKGVSEVSQPSIPASIRLHINLPTFGDPN